MWSESMNSYNEPIFAGFFSVVGFMMLCVIGLFFSLMMMYLSALAISAGWHEGIPKDECVVVQTQGLSFRPDGVSE